jgi:hypothetical protein
VLDTKGHIVRTIQAGTPMPWIGKVTTVGQKARNPHFAAELPAATEQDDS